MNYKNKEANLYTFDVKITRIIMSNIITRGEIF